MDTLSSSGNEKSVLRLITKCLLECLAFLVKFKLADITEHGYLIPSEDLLWDNKGATGSVFILKHLVAGIREIRDYSASLSRFWVAEEMKVSVHNDLPSYVKVYTTLELRPLHTLLPKILEKQSVDLLCYKETKRKTLLALSKEFVRLDNIFRNFWGSNVDLNNFLSVQYGKIVGKPVVIETQPVTATRNIASRKFRSSLKQYLGVDYESLRVIWVTSMIVWHPNLGVSRPYLFTIDDTVNDAHKMFAMEVSSIAEAKKAKKLGLSRREIHPLNDNIPYIVPEFKVNRNGDLIQKTFSDIRDGESFYLLYVWRQENKTDPTNLCKNSFWKPTISALRESDENIKIEPSSGEVECAAALGGAEQFFKSIGGRNGVLRDCHRMHELLQSRRKASPFSKLPSLAKLQAVKKGDCVKVSHNGELFWCTVTRVSRVCNSMRGGEFEGLVNNKLLNQQPWEFGDSIKINYKHVCDIARVPEGAQVYSKSGERWSGHMSQLGTSIEDYVKYEHERCQSSYKYYASKKELQELYFRKINDPTFLEIWNRTSPNMRYHGHPVLNDALCEVYFQWEKEFKKILEKNQKEKLRVINRSKTRPPVYLWVKSSGKSRRCKYREGDIIKWINHSNLEDSVGVITNVDNVQIACRPLVRREYPSGKLWYYPEREEYAIISRRLITHHASHDPALGAITKEREREAYRLCGFAVGSELYCRIEDQDEVTLDEAPSANK